MKKQSKNKQQNKHNSEFIKTVAHAFAYDLLRYSQHGGDMENITATKVYDFLEKLGKKTK